MKDGEKHQQPILLMPSFIQLRTNWTPAIFGHGQGRKRYARKKLNYLKFIKLLLSYLNSPQIQYELNC